MFLTVRKETIIENKNFIYKKNQKLKTKQNILKKYN